MHAVWRDELAVVGNRDHRIEKAADFRNHGGELLRVSLRELALIRRGYDFVERQRGERDPVTSVRLAVAGEHGAAGVADLLLQLADLGRRRAGRAFFRREPDGAGLRLHLARFLRRSSLLARRGLLFGCGLGALRWHGAHCSTVAAVKWERGTRNDDVVDVRGRKAPAGRIAAGGVGVTILLVVVSQLLGVDVTGLFSGGGGGGATPKEQQNSNPEPPKGNDPEAEMVEFIRFVMKDIQDSFEVEFKAQGKQYERAKLYVFRDAIDTACGRSSSAIGPFYCPGDRQAYIDLSFFKDLRARFGAPGDFAQAYVLAHEIGHHLQTLLGVEKQMGKIRGEKARNAASVKQELQADCYAGVWGHHAQGKKLLEIGDLEEALKAAEAIGDDRLQKQAGVEVNPETFTHG